MNALAKMLYKKQQFSKSFKIYRELIANEIVKKPNDVIIHVFQCTGGFKVIQKFLQQDELFLTLSLNEIVQRLQIEVTNIQLTIKQIDSLLNFQYQCLYRDKHIAIRKQCVLNFYFKRNYQEIIDKFINQPRVLLKYYHQAYKFITQFLEKDGLFIYYKYIEQHQDSIEGYECIEQHLQNNQQKIELWNQFIQKNPTNRSGYMKLFNYDTKAINLYIENNPSDFYGYEQKCLIEKNIKYFDTYFQQNFTFETAIKKCQIQYELTKQPDFRCLEEFQKDNILTDIMNNNHYLTQILKAFDLEKIKFYLNYCGLNVLIEQLQQQKLQVQRNVIFQLIESLLKEKVNLENLDQEISNNPFDLSIYMLKINYYEQINQIDEALKLFDLYIKNNPNKIDGYEEKAKFMKYKCKPLQIKQSWDQFINNCDDNEETLLKKIEILTNILKQYDKAIQYLDKYISINPILGLKLKIKLLKDQGRQNELLETINKYLNMEYDEDIIAAKASLLNRLYSDQVALQFLAQFKETPTIIKAKVKIMPKEQGIELLKQFSDWKMVKFKIHYIRDFFGRQYVDELRQLIKQDPHNYKVYKLFFKMTLEEHDLYDEARSLIEEFIENHQDNKQMLKYLN